MSLTSRIQALTAYANEVTGESDTTLADAVATLAEGYGQGGGITIDSIADGSEPSGDFNLSVSSITNYAFYQKRALGKIRGANVTNVGTSAFQNSSITEAFFPNTAQTGSSPFSGCSSMTSFVIGKVGYQNTANGCSALTIADVNPLAIVNNMFNGDTSLTTLIVRSTSFAIINNINAFANTPFASGGTGGNVYVPSALLATYQADSNWSTLSATWHAIEGSIYETQYADGTPIE